MPAVRAPQRADEMAGVDQRIELPRLVERDHLGFHAEVARARTDQFQAVEFAGRCRQHQAAVGMQAAGLAGQRLDLAIQIDGVFLQPRDIGLAVEGVHAAGRVPGRTGRQFALLDQQQVGPADLRQVIEHAGAHHAAADDHRSCAGLHDSSSPDVSRGIQRRWRLETQRPGSGYQPFVQMARRARRRQQQQSRCQRHDDHRHLGDDCGAGRARRKCLWIKIDAAGPGEHRAGLPGLQNSSALKAEDWSSTAATPLHASCQLAALAPAGTGGASISQRPGRTHSAR